MKVFIDLPPDATNKVVLAALREDIKTIRAVMKMTTNEEALEEHRADLQAIKRVMEYYGATY